MNLYNCHRFVLTIASVTLFAGCSYVPDMLNPIEWANTGYEWADTGYDWLMGEDDYSDAALSSREVRKQERDVFALPKCQGSSLIEWHNCEGAYTFSNGDHYVGTWENGDRTGRGVYTWPGGDKYVGEFRNGKKNGQGTVYFGDGEIWVGQFSDGKWVGGEKYGAGEKPPAR